MSAAGMMAKFRTRSVFIEARQHLGYEDALDIELWVNEGKGLAHRAPQDPWPENNAYTLHIDTVEGLMLVSPGDWVIRDEEGDFYPCTDPIFRQTYEPVDEEGSPS